MATGIQFADMTTALNQNILFQCYGFLGSILNALLALLIWKNKELQAHPMKIFMFIAVADSSIFCN